MVTQQLLDRVSEDVRRHCAARGYVSGPNWNPLTPRDRVAALAMAKSLVAAQLFDHYLAIAPEGHVYGYFFERAPAPDECWLLCAKAFAESDPKRAIDAFRHAFSINPGVASRVKPTWRLADLLNENGLG